METKRLLIVDDTTFIRAMLKVTIERLGITQIYEAVNGSDAVLQYKAVLPDLVIMDITMPEMDGLDALREIMKFDRTARVVMLSSRSYKSLVIQAHQIGAVDFIAKPFHTQHLTEIICRHLDFESSEQTTSI